MGRLHSSYSPCHSSFITSALATLAILSRGEYNKGTASSSKSLSNTIQSAACILELWGLFESTLEKISFLPKMENILELNKEAINTI